MSSTSSSSITTTSFGWMVFGFTTAAITGTLFLTTYRLSWKFLQTQTHEGKRMQNLMSYVNRKQSVSTKVLPVFQPLMNRVTRNGNTQTSDAMAMAKTAVIANNPTALPTSKPKRLIYLGNVRIEDRLQFTHFKNANEYWNHYSYDQALTLATKTFMGSILFTTSVFIGLAALFAWSFDISELSQINPLFTSWFAPLQRYTKVDYELTATDLEVDARTSDMSALEFFESLMTDFEYYEQMSSQSLRENEQRKQQKKSINVSKIAEHRSAKQQQEIEK